MTRLSLLPGAARALVRRRADGAARGPVDPGARPRAPRPAGGPPRRGRPRQCRVGARRGRARALGPRVAVEHRVTSGRAAFPRIVASASWRAWRCSLGITTAAYLPMLTTHAEHASVGREFRSAAQRSGAVGPSMARRHAVGALRARRRARRISFRSRHRSSAPAGLALTALLLGGSARLGVRPSHRRARRAAPERQAGEGARAPRPGAVSGRFRDRAHVLRLVTRSVRGRVVLFTAPHARAPSGPGLAGQADGADGSGDYTG